MEYMDEKLRQIINEKEKSEIVNICEEPVKIGNRFYEFLETSFYEDKLKLYIPKDFTDLPENLKDLKYPSVHRPQIIKTDESTSINITLNRLDSQLTEGDVKGLTDEMKAVLKRVNPSNVFFSNGVEEVDGKNIGYLEFKSPAMDGFIYNIMFFLELYGKTVIGTFCCIYSDYEDWREVAFQIIKTIRVIK